MLAMQCEYDSALSTGIGNCRVRNAKSVRVGVGSERSGAPNLVDL